MKKWFEIAMLQLAIKILRGRNVARAMQISRRDNNDLWAMSERIEMIQKRMANDYSEPQPNA